MIEYENTHSPAFVRVAGALYLVIAVAGFFSILWVPMQLVVPGDPLATAEAYVARRGLAHAGVLGDVVMMTAEVILSAMLFGMFRSYGPTLALAATAARLLMAAVMAAMLLFHAAMLSLGATDGVLPSFSAAQRAELAGLMATAHDAGVWVWQVFFALHLVLLAILVARSGAFPKVLALALGVGGVGYLIDSIRAFAFPDATWLNVLGMTLLGIVTFAELGFALWLLVRARRLAWAS